MSVASLPLVSIVIPCYNRETTIATAIESALAQDYPNLEIIVSDNCSTDGTRTVIERYLQDPRIKFSVNEQNLGMLENFRVSITDKAAGKYFSILSSDDEYIHPQFISKSIALILKYDHVLLVKAGSYHKKGDTGKYHTYRQRHEFENGLDYFKQFGFNEDFGWAGILIERSYIGQYRMMERKVVAVDYFINLQLCLMGNIAFLKDVCYQFNLHDANTSSGSYSFPQMEEMIASQHLLFQYAAEHSKIPAQELAAIRKRYEYCFIANVLEDYYRNNRKQWPQAEAKMRALDSEQVDAFYRSKRWRMNALVFYNKTLGNAIVNVKWKLTNWLSG